MSTLARIIIGILLAFVILAGGMVYKKRANLSSETAVQAKFERLLAATSERQWGAVRELVSSEYSDRLQQSEERLVQLATDSLSGFRWVHIRADSPKWEHSEDRAVVTARLIFQGEGSAQSRNFLDNAARVKTPTTFTWKRTGRWPWNWELVSIDNPTLSLAR